MSQPKSDVGVIVRKEKRLKQKKLTRKRSDSASPEGATEQTVAVDTIPGDRVERLWRLEGRPRAVVTDEGLAFYEPGSTKPPPIAANDKQQDRIERDLKMDIQRQKLYIDASTGQPEDFVETAEKRFSDESDVEAAKDAAVYSSSSSSPSDSSKVATAAAGSADTAPKNGPPSGDTKAKIRGGADAKDLTVGSQPTEQRSPTDGNLGKHEKDGGVVTKADDSTRPDSKSSSAKADVKTDSTSDAAAVTAIAAPARAPVIASVAAAADGATVVAADTSGIVAKASGGQSRGSNASKKKKK